MLYHFIGVDQDSEALQAVMRIGWVQYHDYKGESITESNYRPPVLKKTPKVGEVRDKFAKLMDGYEDNIYNGVAVVTEDTKELKDSFDAINMEDQDPEVYKKTDFYALCFSRWQIRNGENVVALSHMEENKYKVVNNTVTIAGKKMTYAGGYDNNELIWKSTPDQMNVATISVVLKRPLTISQIDKLQTRIQELFPDAYNVIIPHPPKVWNVLHPVWAGLALLGILIFISCVLILPVLFVFKKRIKQLCEIKEIHIDIKEMRERYLQELIICEFFSTVIAYILFMFAFSPFLNRIFGGLSSLFIAPFLFSLIVSFYLISMFMFSISVYFASKKDGKKNEK
jgi:hypothetical protein